MSAFGNYKRNCASSSGSGSGSGSGGASGSGSSAFAAHKASQESDVRQKSSKKKKKGPSLSADLDSDDESPFQFAPCSDESGNDEALAPLLMASNIANKKKTSPSKRPLDTDEHEYVRNSCVTPSDKLKTFADVHGARVARKFAENYTPVSSGGTRAISGVLLFGPSGTGAATSLCSTALTLTLTLTLTREIAAGAGDMLAHRRHVLHVDGG